MASRLVYHKVTQDDFNELMSMRKACGWGEENVPNHISRTLTGEEMTTYIFSLPPVDGSSSSPVGMGSIELVDGYHGDLELCNPAEDRVMISSLFVYSKFEGKGYGRDIMDILEGICRTELSAKTITVNTRPRQEDGRTKTKQMAWYERRGYQEFREERPWYSLSDDPAVPRLVACFLVKELSA
ncbi:hypothetical protein BDY24DRAFT_379554 [Mrakia frigida]|uniref:uncharacterized protein n=1 Tax=Mrakia frigida TaxID=29902 RepID=UPI003FCC2574